MSILTHEKKVALINRFLYFPQVFCENLFKSRLWSKQVAILNSLRDNKYTAVKSANTIGKTHDAALAVLWFIMTHRPAKVITTAPTFLQVEEILWKEIASLYHKSKYPLGGSLLKTNLTFTDETFAMGISTNEVYRFQGFHSPYLLVVIDEAAGVPPEIWEAIESLHPYRVLAIGNPNEVAGNFYECFRSSLWNQLSISCQDAVDWQVKNGKIPGLVSQEWIRERKEEWGEGSPADQIHVKGEI